jgi:enoyl-CoA hydratase/carnithine racemase
VLVVDLGDPPTGPSALTGVVVAVGSAADITSSDAQSWIDGATFTLSEDEVTDRRVVTVESTATALVELTTRFEMWPQAATVCDHVLRAASPAASTVAGVITESLAYSTLQAGGEFAAWLRQRGPATVPALPDPVVADRDGDTLHVRFNRPSRHNAFSNDARAALLEALDVARRDPSVDEVILTGNGPSFCSGGDLQEFGTAPDPATAHLIRVTRSPARLLAELTDRVVVEVHGACIGAGVELAAFARRIVSSANTWFALPEVGMGLVPGAGGTVSIPRRIGRHRAAALALSGDRLDAEQALTWGLVDEIGPRHGTHPDPR